jgi:aromatic-L-amino-acid decarboxylase
MDPTEFRRHGHELVEWIADYLAGSERYPVLPQVSPGDVRAALPTSPPEQGEPFADIMADFERVLVPALTHWNHPGFFGYFAISSSASAVLAEFLSAALNQQAMLWRTSPAATELEEVSLGWLRELLGLPTSFEGVIYDTASISTLHALAAARELAVPDVGTRGLAGRSDVPPLRVYCSDQAHSSVDKAVMALGLGRDALRRIPVDDAYRLSAGALDAAITADVQAGARPVAVVATIGTTSTTSVDPVRAIADVAARHGLWLHVDAAYAGPTAMLPEYHDTFAGWDAADSIVVNPHKWLFTPFDLSAFYCRRMDVVRRAFSVVPEYLRTAEAAEGVRNLMDTGIQLGRRFRSLKLWMLLRHVGAERLRALLREHIRLARVFAEWVDAHPDFERLAPVPFSVVCFRAVPSGRAWADDRLDAFNQRLIDAVNAEGDVFLSHTRLGDHLVLRLAIGNLRTTELHVGTAWDALQRHAAALSRLDPP